MEACAAFYAAKSLFVSQSDKSFESCKIKTYCNLRAAIKPELNADIH